MLVAKNVGYEINGRKIISDASLSIENGDKIGIVGPNGSGKTTMLRLLAGEIIPDVGVVVKDNCTVGMLSQNINEWLDYSVYSFLEEVTGVNQVKQQFENACRDLENGDIEASLVYDDALNQYNRFDVGNFGPRASKALRLAGLPDMNVDQKIENLSGGQKTKVALAAIFASHYDVVLLDEPTNNLDADGTLVLEKFVKDTNTAFAIVSHDRRFLKNATSRIIEVLDEGRGIKQYGLGYDEYEDSRERTREAELKHYKQIEYEKKRLKYVVKSVAKKAILASRVYRQDNDKLVANYRHEKAASGLSRMAKSVQSRIDKLDLPEKPGEAMVIDFSFQEVNKKKMTLASMDEVLIKYPNSDITFGPYSLNIKPGDRIIVRGNNGSGKTTFLESLAKNINISSGKFILNKGTRIAYMNQQQDLPKPNDSPINNLLSLAPGLELHDAIQLLLKFNFSKDVIYSTKAINLSGGERAKIILASITANSPNLIIFDEPTNNLDIPNIEALEKALVEFSGAILIASHDREFIDKVGITQTINTASC